MKRKYRKKEQNKEGDNEGDIRTRADGKQANIHTNHFFPNTFRIVEALVKSVKPRCLKSPLDFTFSFALPCNTVTKLATQDTPRAC